MPKNLVEFCNVSKTYQKNKVIDNISFTIAKNSIITLVGPNGAGKTTIAKMILGQEKPTQGTISLCQNISFGYVPQQLNLNRSLPMSVANLISVLTNKVKINDSMLKNLLEFAQIDKIKNQDILQISGGQLRRVFLAACLINQANLIILDEPTKELDIVAQSNFYKMLEEIKSNFGISILIISHDLHTVIKSSDQVLCLNHHLCCYGKPTEQYQEILDHIGFYQHRHNHRHN